MYDIMMLYAISATTSLLGKNLLAYCSPLFLTGVRTSGAGILFLWYAWWLYGKNNALMAKILMPCAYIALFSFFLSNTLKLYTLNALSSMHVGALAFVEPLLVIIFMRCMFDQRINIQQLCATLLCMGGALWMMPRLNGIVLHGGIAAAMVISVACSVYGALSMRRLIVHENVPIALVMGLSMSIAGVLSLVATSTESFSCMLTLDSIFPFAVYMMSMIAISNIIGYGLYGTLLARHSALIISCGSFVRPVFVALYRWVVGEQCVSVNILVGGVIVCVGLALLYCCDRMYAIKKSV